MDDITLLLQKWREGDGAAENQLFALVFPNLRRLAHYLVRGERKGHTLQATELVNQAYLRLVAAKNQDWRNRRHFFAIAARVMRRYLIDYARRPHPEMVVLDDNKGLSAPRQGQIGSGCCHRQPSGRACGDSLGVVRSDRGEVVSGAHG